MEELPELKKAVQHFEKYISSEILADTIEFNPVLENGETVEVDDKSFKIFISKS